MYIFVFFENNIFYFLSLFILIGEYIALFLNVFHVQIFSNYFKTLFINNTI